MQDSETGPNRFAKWPATDQARLRPWCTPHIATKFTIGSCFARNIEEHLSRLGVPTPMMRFSVPRTEYEGRPNGIINKYTPASILSELHYALEPESALAEDDHFLDLGDQVLDLHLNSPKAVSLARARERRREVRQLFGAARDAEVVIMTLGLVEAWYDQKHAVWINDALPPRLWKQFGDRFRFHVLSYAECFSAIESAVQLLNRTAPKRIILTVSPVPLGRTFTADDVLIANCHSKATLRTVADDIAARFDRDGLLSGSHPIA